MVRAALNLTSDIVLFFAPTTCGSSTSMTRHAQRLGYSKRDLLTMELPEIVEPEVRDGLASAIRQSQAEPASPVAKVTTLRRRDGSEFPVEATIRQFGRHRQNLTVLVGRDATERQCLERLLAFPAHLDPLTGLPNLAVLESRLQAVASQTPSSQGRLALFLVDLNRFKQINDEWGHLAGDSVLKAVADRLAKCVRGKDVVVRDGGDEFVVLADGIVDAQEAAGLAERIVAAVNKPIALEGEEISVSASVGIAIARTSDNSPGAMSHVSLKSLIAHADRGMYRAKAVGGRGHYVIHDEQAL